MTPIPLPAPTLIRAVFSGSGTLYPMHLGALSYVETRLGLRVVEAAGVSGGALAASLRGLVPVADDSLLSMLLEDKPTWRFWDLSLMPWRTWSVFGGRSMRRMLRRRFRGGMSASGIPLRIVTAPLSRDPARHPAGPAVWGSDLTPLAPWADVIAASMSLPGVFPPVRLPDGRRHLDGGILNNLPVDAWGSAAGSPPLVVFQVRRGRPDGAEAEPRNGFAFALRVLDSLVGNSSRELLDQMPAGSVLVPLYAPPEQDGVLDLNLTAAEVQALWMAGWNQAEALFRGRDPFVEDKKC